METKERVKPVINTSIKKQELYLITFRENGRYICCKHFWGFSFANAVVEAKRWADALPYDAPDDEWSFFDYDYAGH